MLIFYFLEKDLGKVFQQILRMIFQEWDKI